MSTIREIARLARVSQVTVSLILNGKAEQYRIAETTQQRVLEIARSISYQPNISAKRLRSMGEKVLPIIALLWPLDTQSAFMSHRLLRSMQQTLHGLDDEYELLIQPYQRNHLQEVSSLITGTRFNGALITSPSTTDELYLEHTHLKVPIVLYQRNSTVYPTVNIDNAQGGSAVAQLFYQKKHMQVGIIIPNSDSAAIRLRAEGFFQRAQDLGIEVTHRVDTEFSERGGYNAVQQIVHSKQPLPRAIFVLSDQMAIGVLSALNEAGIQVPQKLEVVGFEDDAMASYTIPRLTTVHVPVEPMVGTAVKTLVQLMKKQTVSVTSHKFETHIVFRDSCLEPNTF